MIRLADVDKAKFGKRGNAIGNAVVVTSKEGDNITDENEFYQLPGFASIPAKNDRVMITETEFGYSVILGSHNYEINVSVQKGQVKIYSTNADGSQVKALIFLKENGDIIFSQDGKTIYEENVEMEKNLKVSEEITVGTTNIEVSKHGHITVLGPTVGPILPIQ
jgi:hypothetical protein